MCLFICCDENCCKIPKCKDIKVKRYFLPLIGVFALAALPEFRDFVYLPIVIIFGKKLPNYEVDERIKRKFQLILEVVLIVTNALLTGALADYWLYKTTGNEGYMEIVGITGGIIKIFQMVNNTISRLMLKILKRCIKKENKQFKRRQVENIERIIRLKRHQSTIWREIEMTNQPENRIITRERADTF